MKWHRTHLKNQTLNVLKRMSFKDTDHLLQLTRKHPCCFLEVWCFYIWRQKQDRRKVISFRNYLIKSQSSWDKGLRLTTWHASSKPSVLQRPPFSCLQWLKIETGWDSISYFSKSLHIVSKSLYVGGKKDTGLVCSRQSPCFWAIINASKVLKRGFLVLVEDFTRKTRKVVFSY